MTRPTLDTPAAQAPSQAEAGAPTADALFASLYAELHRLARRQLMQAGAGVSLSPTTVLHEAYGNLAGREELAFPDRARFMAYAGRAMRGLIIDYARARHAHKRGGAYHITALDDEEGPGSNSQEHEELTELSAALDELARVEPALAQVVDLRFFCGFSFGEIADMQQVSERTVQRHWEKARLYLHDKLRVDGDR